MGAASRWCLKAAAVAAVASAFVSVLLPGCQFPNYTVVQGGGAGALPVGGGGMAGLAGTSDEGGRAPAEGGAGEGAEGGGSSGTGGAEPDLCAPDDCRPIAPGEWVGPVAYWEADGDDEPPDCPPGYTEASDWYHGLIAPPGDCQCSCAPKGQSCEPNTLLTIYTDLNCATPCGTVAAPSTCTAVAGTDCNGSQGSLRAPIPAPSGGSCVADITPIAPAKWERAGRVCEPSNIQVCSAPNQVCAPKPPAPYRELACVRRNVMPGEPWPACPPGYRGQSTQLHAGLVDTRDCSDCVCSTLTGGKCAGTLSLYRDAECSAENPPMHTLGPSCTQFNLGMNDPDPRAVHGAYTLTPGTCSVTTASKPVGSAAEDGMATLVCCE